MFLSPLGTWPSLFSSMAASLICVSMSMSLLMIHLEFMFLKMDLSDLQLASKWFFSCISIGNSMICSDIWQKYHKWYCYIDNCYTWFHKPLGEWNLRQFWNIMSGINAKYQVQIVLLFVYTTTRKRFVIFTCRYSKLSWNTTALSQSNCSNFSCSSIKLVYVLS